MYLLVVLLNGPSESFELWLGRRYHSVSVDIECEGPLCGESVNYDRRPSNG